MRRRGLWLLVAIAVCAAALALGLILRTGGSPSDWEQLQGTWVRDDDRAILRVNGNLAVIEDFSEPRRFLFRLEPRTSPKRITLCDADGPGISPPFSILGLSFGSPFADHPNLQFRGIYELDEDRLRICLSPQGADFPKSFDAKTSVQVYRRP